MVRYQYGIAIVMLKIIHFKIVVTERLLPTLSTCLNVQYKCFILYCVQLYLLSLTL
jgi:hypothetical protein